MAVKPLQLVQRWLMCGTAGVGGGKEWDGKKQSWIERRVHLEHSDVVVVQMIKWMLQAPHHLPAEAGRSLVSA